MHDLLLLLRRFAQIVAAFLRFVLIPELRSRFGARAQAPSRAVGLRQAFEHLGGAWIKVGQTLALRFDLLPPAYCTEFLKLLNEAKPFPISVVRSILKQEFGREPEEMFAWFNPEPLAAASIAQVHRATSFDGQHLAVKIQRPQVGQLFAADFLVMRCFAYFLDLIQSFNGTSLRGVVDEFARWTREEIDFHVEARNTHRMLLCAGNDPLQVNAHVFFEYSGERVITTGFIEAILLLDVIRAMQRSDHTYLKSLSDQGYDLARVGRHICWNMLNQMFRDGFFHADLHPGNLFVLPGNAIGYVDYGIVGRLSEETRKSLRYYIRCLFQKNFDNAVDELLRWVTPAPFTDLEQARRDLISVLEDYRYGFDPSASGPLQLTSGFLVNIMSVFRKHKLTMSQTLTLYFKAVLTTDSVVFELNPKYDLFADIQRFFKSEFASEITKVQTLPSLTQQIWIKNFQFNKILLDVGKIQNATRSVEILLDTLRTRLVLCCFWTIVVAIGTFVFHFGEMATVFRSTLGVFYGWISSCLYLIIGVLLIVMWRQGHRLAALDGRSSARRGMRHRTPWGDR